MKASELLALALFLAALGCPASTPEPGCPAAEIHPVGRLTNHCDRCGYEWGSVPDASTTCPACGLCDDDQDDDDDSAQASP